MPGNQEFLQGDVVELSEADAKYIVGLTMRSPIVMRAQPVRLGAEVETAGRSEAERQLDD